MTVREALALINQTLDEALAEQEGDFDADSRWALTWFEQNGFSEGEYGRAEQLSKTQEHQRRWDEGGGDRRVQSGQGSPSNPTSYRPTGTLPPTLASPLGRPFIN